MFGRAQDLHPGVRRVHGRLGLLRDRPDAAPADRRPGHPGRRRRVHVRQLGRPRDRRVPALASWARRSASTRWSSAPGLILGPILGGWLTGFGWRFVFWFNVPLGIIGHRRGDADPGREDRRPAPDLDRLVGSRPLPRRAAGADDLARVRRPVRLDDLVDASAASSSSWSSMPLLHLGRGAASGPRSSTCRCSATASSRWAT